MDVKTKLNLFNSLVLPILFYACEVWGFNKAEQLDRMYLGFLKNLLGVRKTVPTAFIYKELGVFPLDITRKVRIVKYWFKILSLKDTNPVKITYKQLVKDLEEDNSVTNWASLLKRLLEENGFGNIWLQQNTENSILFLRIFEQRLKDIFLQEKCCLINIKEKYTPPSKSNATRVWARF